MRLFRDLWTTSPRRTELLIALILVGAVGQAAAAALAGPVLVHRSGAMFGLLAVALVVAVLSDVTVNLAAARLTADWAADVRRRLCTVAFGQDLPTLETTPVGELLDRIDNDVYQVASELRGHGTRIVQSVAVGGLSVLAALLVWWPAGLGMLVLTAVTVAGLNQRTRRISPARMREEEAWSDLAAVMEEAIHGQDDVRTTLARPYVLRLFARRASTVLARGRVVWRMASRVTAIASAVSRVGIAAVVLGGIWAMATGRVDGAGLTAVWLLAIAFGGTVEHISRLIPELQYALGAWGRIQLLAASHTEPVGGRPAVEADLIIRGLSFRYRVRDAEADQDSGGDDRASDDRASDGRGSDDRAPDDRAPVLSDVTLTFHRGRKYALIGRTGSGKSTLARVLTRAVEVPPATVFLGDTDLCDLDIEGLRRWVALVPQRTEILAGTLAENIALFDPDLMDAAGSAIRELGLESWVAGLPDGMHTRLGEGGTVLSAGQEQLVAFARILVRDPGVVILDEATARMDPVTEASVHDATERLLRDRIGILIAHRLSSVRRCDEVVVLADGKVVEAGPLHRSRRFAELLATSQAPAPDAPAAARTATTVGPTTTEVQVLERLTPVNSPDPANGRTDPPPLPPAAPARTLRGLAHLVVNDTRFGLSAVGLFLAMTLFGLDGPVLSWLWADVVDGSGNPLRPATGLIIGLLVTAPLVYLTGAWFPEWWVRQMLRISLRLVHGQTGPRRISAHTPAEVVAQAGDTERVVILADNLIDQLAGCFLLVTMTIVSASLAPAAFLAATMVASGLAAALFGPVLERSAARTVAARAAFVTALVSSLSAARTVKLAGATRVVLDRLAALDRSRSDLLRREVSRSVWARSAPPMIGGLLPIAVWAMYLSGQLSAGAALVAVGSLAASRWLATTTASLISQLPSARVWTRRTVAMAGVSRYAAAVPEVDLSAGTAPAPVAPERHPLHTLELVGFSAVHEDGTIGISDIDLTITRGELVLVIGPVGSGKSSLLRALAGIVHHTGAVRWNGTPVTRPELFLRPHQVGYVAQLPRVLSGTVADNIRLGHAVDPSRAVGTAQLDHDLAAAGAGLGLLIGHKGTRLSGGQLQRLALARALAPRTELLLADDVSSALDVITELNLWRAVRAHGLTVIGSTSKRAALAQADRVVVLIDGRAADHGPWAELADRWGHLAG
ncbi:MAG: ABC transporter ATP-binding protein [Dactylosporangium sp.]|nr:ABC transporter ATP-binding protein/permease [Dactylosporangium sp.]NNJ62715.1 ABC transporter ATP-binding protein [Dactylosporangium sp.]